MSTQIHETLSGSHLVAVKSSRPREILRALCMPILLSAFSLFLIINMLAMDVPESVAFPGPRFFPAIIAVGMLALAVIDGISAFTKRSEPSEEELASSTNLIGLCWAVGGFVLFIFLLEPLGWILAAALLFWCVAFGFGATKLIHAAVVGLTLSSLTYLAFSLGLGLALPSGFLGGLI